MCVSVIVCFDIVLTVEFVFLFRLGNSLKTEQTLVMYSVILHIHLLSLREIVPYKARTVCRISSPWGFDRSFRGKPKITINVDLKQKRVLSRLIDWFLKKVIFVKQPLLKPYHLMLSTFLQCTLYWLEQKQSNLICRMKRFENVILTSFFILINGIRNCVKSISKQWSKCISMLKLIIWYRCDH